MGPFGFYRSFGVMFELASILPTFPWLNVGLLFKGMLGCCVIGEVN